MDLPSPPPALIASTAVAVVASLTSVFLMLRLRSLSSEPSAPKIEPHDEELAVQLEQAIQAKEKAEQLRREERTGRIKAEQALRSLQSVSKLQGSSADADASASDTGAVTLAPVEGAAGTRPPTDMLLRPIGHLHSVFKTRNGTPRQGLVVTRARATLRLDKSLKLDGRYAFDGIEHYSHLYLIFGFHENTNLPGAPLKSKVTPPRFGQKVGVFATRSPHRPNPLGLSLVTLDAVKDGVLHLSGIDLIDGTPIYDIKGYNPDVDAFPDATRPEWIPPTSSTDFSSVEFTEEALASLEHLCRRNTFQFYPTFQEAHDFLVQALSFDIRSIHRRSLAASQADAAPLEHAVQFDRVVVTYTTEATTVPGRGPSDSEEDVEPLVRIIRIEKNPRYFGANE